jgi:hypothetical protein
MAFPLSYSWMICGFSLMACLQWEGTIMARDAYTTSIDSRPHCRAKVDAFVLHLLYAAADTCVNRLWMLQRTSPGCAAPSPVPAELVSSSLLFLPAQSAASE